MKKFLKKTNRGIVLGAIVLLGFIVFVIKDTSDFKKNKPEIQSAVTDYVNALAECAVSVGDTGEFQKRYENIIAQWWSASKISGNDFYGFDMSSMKNRFNSTNEESEKNDSRVFKWSAYPRDFSIRKAGTDIAKAEFSCNVSAEFIGDPFLVCPADVMKISNLAYYDDSDSKHNENVKSKISVDLSCELMVKEVGGKWKICRASNFGWNEPVISVADSDNTEGGTQ